MIKTIITIGPETDTEKMIAYFSKKHNLFRFNGSHSDVDWHFQTINRVLKINADAFILLDIPGSKPRTANTSAIQIEKYQSVTFGNHHGNTLETHIECTKPLPKINSDTKAFSVNDGQFTFDITEIGSTYITGISRDGFKLQPRKGINVPNSIYDEIAQFKVYSKFIDDVRHLHVDALGLSFVQTGELVRKVRHYSPKHILISKIENSEGLANCVDIIKESDGIMIDRGDLGAEIGLENLYDAIELISFQTKKLGKPLIMATENLETMLKRGAPSKSEVVSLSHSASIGVDCVMLSEETAISPNAQATVDWLHSFLNTAKEPKYDFSVDEKHDVSIWNTVSQLPNIPIIIMSKSGRALLELLARLPNHKVTLITDNNKIAALSKLYRNDVTVLMQNISKVSPIETIRKCINNNFDTIFGDHYYISAISVSKYQNTPTANTLTIFSRDDYFSTGSGISSKADG